MVTNICGVLPNVYGTSEWNLLRVTILVPAFLRRLLGFLEKFVHPYGIICRVLSCFLGLSSYLTVNQSVTQSLTPRVLCVGKADPLYKTLFLYVSVFVLFTFKVEVDEESLSPEEQKERKIMKLLLKIKNGTPPMRKAALRQITDKAREFGAGPLFNQILPLLMSPTLEDQERHLLVKVIDRILYKLDDLVRPYVHKVRDVTGSVLGVVMNYVYCDRS